MSRDEVRFKPSRRYLSGGIVFLSLAMLAAWASTRWTAAAVPASVLLVIALFLIALATAPAIVLTRDELRIGRRRFAWSQITRLDHTNWISPLLVRLTLDSGRRVLLIYPGDYDNSRALLVELRRNCVQSLIDGYPYRDVVGELVHQAEELTGDGRPRYRLLRSEDELEVERLYQKLKSVGRLDTKDEN